MFGVNGRDRPKGWVAGVLTDCLSGNVDNWRLQSLGLPRQEEQDKQGRDQTIVTAVVVEVVVYSVINQRIQNGLR